MGRVYLITKVVQFTHATLYTQCEDAGLQTVVFVDL